MNLLHRARIAALPLLLIPLILIGVATQLRQPPATPAFQAAAPPPEADYYLRGAEISTMGEDGALLYRVLASDVLHFPDQRIALSDVKVDYLDGPWTLLAEQGEIPADQSTLQLSGSVRMSGTLRNGEAVRLETPDLAVQFDARIIHTEASVSMTSDNVTATARGMHTDLAGQELKLLSEVRVRYEP